MKVWLFSSLVLISFNESIAQKNLKWRTISIDSPVPFSLQGNQKREIDSITSFYSYPNGTEFKDKIILVTDSVTEGKDENGFRPVKITIVNHSHDTLLVPMVDNELDGISTEIMKNGTWQFFQGPDFSNVTCGNSFFGSVFPPMSSFSFTLKAIPSGNIKTWLRIRLDVGMTSYFSEEIPVTVTSFEDSIAGYAISQNDRFAVGEIKIIRNSLGTLKTYIGGKSKGRVSLEKILGEKGPSFRFSKPDTINSSAEIWGYTCAITSKGPVYFEVVDKNEYTNSIIRKLLEDPQCDSFLVGEVKLYYKGNIYPSRLSIVRIRKISNRTRRKLIKRFIPEATNKKAGAIRTE